MLHEMPAEKDISTAVANVVPPNSSACQCACGVLVPVIEVSQVYLRCEYLVNIG